MRCFVFGDEGCGKGGSEGERAIFWDRPFWLCAALCSVWDRPKPKGAIRYFF